jgi:hypothetical protein
MYTPVASRALVYDTESTHEKVQLVSIRHQAQTYKVKIRCTRKESERNAQLFSCSDGVYSTNQVA